MAFSNVFVKHNCLSVCLPDFFCMCRRTRLWSYDLVLLLFPFLLLKTQRAGQVLKRAKCFVCFCFFRSFIIGSSVYHSSLVTKQPTVSAQLPLPNTARLLGLWQFWVEGKGDYTLTNLFFPSLSICGHVISKRLSLSKQGRIHGYPSRVRVGRGYF